MPPPIQQEEALEDSPLEAATRKVSYRDMVVDNGFDKLNPKETADMVAEEYVQEKESFDASSETETPFNPKPNIEVSLEEYEDWCRPWKRSLIVKPLEKNLNLQAMERWVSKRWAKKDVVRVMDLEENFFLVRFFNQEDYSNALFKGPWMIIDHYLLIQRWRLLFVPQEVNIQKVVVWIQIPNLSAELYNKYFLWKVGKALGTMLKVDELTSIHSRGKFARICMEIDLNKKLIPYISALGKDFKLEYEGLHQICFKCGRYGHKVENCHEIFEDLIEKVVAVVMEVDRSNQECGGGNPNRNRKEPLEQEHSFGEESSKEGNQEIDGRRPTEISKKKQPIQSQPKQSNQIDLVNASSQVTDPSTSNARRVQNEKNKNDHSDYWRSFSRLNKEIAKKYQYGEYSNVAYINDSVTNSLISSIMGGGAKDPEEVTTANKPPGPGEGDPFTDMEEMELSRRKVDMEPSLSSPKPMEA
ncbi:hypothetical protein AHAS_Ahas16G0277600 [Arachis hypogaea]